MTGLVKISRVSRVPDDNPNSIVAYSPKYIVGHMVTVFQSIDDPGVKLCFDREWNRIEWFSTHCIRVQTVLGMTSLAIANEYIKSKFPEVYSELYGMGVIE